MRPKRRPKLVGRREERALLLEALAEVDSGNQQALAICGEPGIGKTRLLGELIDQADGRGALSLAGRAAQFERHVPFAVFIDALDGYLAAQGQRWFDSIDPHDLNELARIFPSLWERGEADGGVGQSERFRAHQSVGSLLERLAASRSLVLALDDLQWADEASLELVAHLLRRPPAGAQLLAFAFRSGEAPPRLSDAIADAIRDGRLQRLELAPLSEHQVAEVLGESVAADVGARLHRESGGNPFYLEQLHRSDVAGAVGGGGGVAEHGIPQPVAASLAGELSTLPAPARQLLEGASVAGDPFELEVAATAAELSESESRSAIDELLARELTQVTEVPGRFRFRHPIVHRTVYAEVSPGWRMGAHSRARDLLSQRGAGPTQLAHHVEQAAKPGDGDAIAVLERAGHDAADLAPGPAADWFAAALRLLPDTDQPHRLELLVPMATALTAAGRLEESRSALLEAIDLMPAGADDDRVALIAFLAGVDLQLGHHEEPRRLLSSTLEALPVRSSWAAIAIQVELAAGGVYTADIEAAKTWGAAAFTAAREAGESVLEARAAAISATALVEAGELEAAEPWRRDAARTFEALTDAEVAQHADLAWWLGAAYLFSERYAEGARIFDRGLSASRAAGTSLFLIEQQIAGAWCLNYLGRCSEADELADAAIEGARVALNQPSLCWALLVSCCVSTALGDFDASLRTGEESVAIAGDLEEGAISVAAHGHFALACVDAGDHQRCLDEMELAGAPGFPLFAADRKPLFCEALVRACIGLGRAAEAERWVRTGEDLVEGLDLPVAKAAILRARARLSLERSEAEPAARLALQAAASQRERDVPIEAARSRILAGQALALAGHRDEAITELERAHAVLDQYGAVRWRDEAAHELRRLGKRKPRTAPRQSASSGIDSLSEREREIADLVAQAKTNREIAETLYISEKTVEKHLSKVFAKLGVKGRAAVGGKLVAPPEK